MSQLTCSFKIQVRKVWNSGLICNLLLYYIIIVSMHQIEVKRHGFETFLSQKEICAVTIQTSETGASSP